MANWCVHLCAPVRVRFHLDPSEISINLFRALFCWNVFQFHVCSCIPRRQFNFCFTFQCIPLCSMEWHQKTIKLCLKWLYLPSFRIEFVPNKTIRARNFANLKWTNEMNRVDRRDKQCVFKMKLRRVCIQFTIVRKHNTNSKQKSSRFMLGWGWSFSFVFVFRAFCFIFCIYPNHFEQFSSEKRVPKHLKILKSRKMLFKCTLVWVEWEKQKRDDWNWTEQYNLNAQWQKSYNNFWFNFEEKEEKRSIVAHCAFSLWILTWLDGWLNGMYECVRVCCVAYVCMTPTIVFVICCQLYCVSAGAILLCRAFSVSVSFSIQLNFAWHLCHEREKAVWLMQRHGCKYQSLHSFLSHITL